MEHLNLVEYWIAPELVGRDLPSNVLIAAAIWRARIEGLSKQKSLDELERSFPEIAGRLKERSRAAASLGIVPDDQESWSPETVLRIEKAIRKVLGEEYQCASPELRDCLKDRD